MLLTKLILNALEENKINCLLRNIAKAGAAPAVSVKDI